MINSVTKSGFIILLLLFLAPWPKTTTAQNDTSDQQLFQLKVYHFDNREQEQRLDEYLKNAYIPALHRMGNGPVGVFKPLRQDTTSDKRIYVLTSFESFRQFESLDKQLANDRRYQKSGSSYIRAAHDNPTFTEIETILLRAFSYAPKIQKSGLKKPKTERIYELRSYESATEAQNINKVEMFNEGGEVELFEELGFNAIFYGNVLTGSDMPNLMYMISFEDMESRDAHWGKFIDSPIWKKISSMEKYQNNVSHIDNYFLRAAEYSDL